MNGINFFLVIISFGLALFQLSVFGTWQVGGLAPQVWLVAVFWANRLLPRLYGPAFILFYFLFYDLLVGRPWPFTTGLVVILGLEVVSKIAARFMGGRVLPAAVLFGFLNLLSFWYLRKPLQADLFWLGLTLNLLLSLLFLPAFIFLRSVLLARSKSQLSLKLN